MICSTLSGMMAIKHPTLGVLVREDGMVLRRKHRYTNIYRWVKGHKDRDGYCIININHKCMRVHRLVAETFIPNLKNKPTVDHINRITDDNRVQNLRWATHREQMENHSRIINRVDYGVRCCENKSEYNKNYYQSNKGKILDTNREYSKAHMGEILAYHRKWYAEHKEKIREQRRKQYEKKKQEKLSAKERQ